jgi:lysophospholipase L1-like esterase
VAEHRPDCQVFAKVGITTHDWYKQFGFNLHSPRDLLVISLGNNDFGSIADYQDLLNVRHSITAKKVIWLVPANNQRAAEDVRTIASVMRDGLIEVRQFPRAPDKVHPTGESYKLIAEEIEP